MMPYAARPSISLFSMIAALRVLGDDAHRGAAA